MDDGGSPGSAAAGGDGPDEARLPRTLSGHTGEDVVAVETTAREMASGGEVVVRVVAPGARRLQADDRDDVLRAAGTGGGLPHPFGLFGARAQACAGIIVHSKQTCDAGTMLLELLALQWRREPRQKVQPVTLPIACCV
jgi:hypothetical protein